MTFASSEHRDSGKSIPVAAVNMLASVAIECGLVTTATDLLSSSEKKNANIFAATLRLRCGLSFRLCELRRDDDDGDSLLPEDDFTGAVEVLSQVLMVILPWWSCQLPG